MKTNAIIIAIISVVAIFSLILIVQAGRLGGESGYCMLVGECVFDDEGKGFRWRQCYGAYVAYSSWFHDYRCSQQITGGAAVEKLDPDIWTKHPKIVKEVLQKAGFKCGVKPTILPEKYGIERKPEWTCRFKWEGGYAEFYIHKKED